MRKSLGCGLLLAAAVATPNAVCAGTPEELPVWPGTAPGAEPWLATPMPDSTLVRPTLTAHWPPKDQANGTAVLICPGGGYSGLAVQHEGYDIARWLNARGAAGFVLQYRRPVLRDQRLYDHTIPSLDARRALRLIRARAAEWGLKPDRIGIMGFSAGGHLAATVGVHHDAGQPEAADPVERVSCRPDFMILIYPVISMTEAWTHVGSRDNLLGAKPDPHWADYYSCERQVTGRTPPAFLLSTSDDGVKPDNSVRMYQALGQAGVKAELHVFEQGGHGYGMRNTGRPVTKHWPVLLESWLQTRGLLKQLGG